jgi:putative redox protein
LKDVKVLCSGEQQPDPPFTFTKIHLQYHVYGNVNPKNLTRAIQLSEEKYCSVISTLRPGVPVSSDFDIHPEMPETDLKK